MNVYKCICMYVFISMYMYTRALTFAQKSYSNFVCLLILIFEYISSHLIVIRLSGVGSRGELLKQGAPYFPFPGHIDHL